MKRILCIDDSPERYRLFYRHVATLGVQLIVTDHPEAISHVLDYPVLDAPLIGVCLDHDMPGRDAAKIAVELLAPYNYPVAIVSNNHAGADRLAGILGEYAVPHQRFPASTGGLDWVESILRWFEEQASAGGVVLNLTSEEIANVARLLADPPLPTEALRRALLSNAKEHSPVVTAEERFPVVTGLPAQLKIAEMLFGRPIEGVGTVLPATLFDTMMADDDEPSPNAALRKRSSTARRIIQRGPGASLSPGETPQGEPEPGGPEPLPPSPEPLPPSSLPPSLPSLGAIYYYPYPGAGGSGQAAHMCLLRKRKRERKEGE